MNNLIDREPAANANSKPLQRGHWRTVLFERQPHKQIIAANACSECGCVQIHRRAYCPNCNARMDGGEKDV